MIKEQRINIIMDEINRKGYLSMEDIAKKINVSVSTIRRDIKELETKVALERVRGGAVKNRVATSYEPPFAERLDLFNEEKQRIAKAAHDMVQENETLFLDSGTTVLELAKLLNDVGQLYAATNDLMIATALSAYNNVDLMVLGGKVRKKHHSITGYFAESMLSQIHADKAFIGADGIDFNIGVMNFSTEEVQVKQMMMQASQQVIVLCDHSKFDRIAFVNVCAFKDIDLLITGKEADPAYLQKLSKLRVKCITV